MKKLFTLVILVTLVSCHAQEAKGYAQAQTKGTTTRSNTSVSVSDSNETYSYSAMFDKSKTKETISEIEKAFGKSQKEGHNYVWRDGDILEIRAREGKISIEFDKGSTEIYTKVKNLGEEISAVINGK